MKNAQYWKEYRLKNSDKLKAYKKARYHASKRTTLAQDVSKPIEPIQVKVEISKPRKCQSSYCKNPGSETIVAGLKAWLCLEHKPKA